MSHRIIIHIGIVGLALLTTVSIFAFNKFSNKTKIYSSELSAIIEQNVTTFDIPSDPEYRDYMPVLHYFMKDHNTKKADFFIIW